jgi:hypothetical protein
MGHTKFIKEQHRVLAASAWASSNYRIATAVHHFSSAVSNAGLPMPKAPEKLIRKWGEQLRVQQNITPGHSRAGRRPSISPEQASQLLRELLGWKEAGLKAPYPSISNITCCNPTACKLQQEEA